MNLLGIDIGGTKTSVCLGDDRGEIRVSERMSSTGFDSVDAYLRSLVALCRRVAEQAGTPLSQVDRVGIAAPGPMSVAKGILFAPPNNVGWRNVPIVDALTEALDRPVFLNNDANAAGLAEYHFGEFRGTPNLIYLTCSTGMGGGVIVNGQMLQGATDMGGEVGHMILDRNGPLCGCGQRGCFEAFCGGRNMALRLQEAVRSSPGQSRMTELCGGRIEDIDMRVFEDAVREGDAFAVAQWEEYADRMAQGIGCLLMAFNPQAIVLGTIAVSAGDLLLRPVCDRLPKYAWKWSREACRIRPSQLGRRLGDLGALAVAVGAG